MADIEIVIKIPETLKRITDEEDYRAFSHPVWLAILMESILNGTPLAESDDCVSREELLTALDTWDKFGVDDTGHLFRLDNLSYPHYEPYIHYRDVIKAVKGMPRVQLNREKHDEEVIKETVASVWGKPPCDDAISRQAVLDCQQIFYDNAGYKTYYVDIEDIKDLPLVYPQEPKWIPVSERLPEKSTWVLVTCKNPDGYIYLDIKLINQYTGLWDGDEDFIGTVLAWMPLPKPYKAESEE
jgi:hypothetical protein